MTTERGRPIVFDRLVTLHISGRPTGKVDSYNHPIMGPESTRRVWAARSDTPSRDQVLTGDVVAALTSRRYTIRLENAAGVSTGIRVTDEDGAVVIVKGMRQYARRRVELYVESIQ